MSLQVNTASGTTIDLIDIILLLLDISDHIFMHNFIIYKKLKQPVIIGLDFAQHYKIRLDWNVYETLFFRHEGKKIATAVRKGNQCQLSVALLETPVGDKYAGEQLSYHLITYQGYH